MLRRILDPARRALLDELRGRLDALRVLLVRGGAPEDDQKALARSIAQLDEPFLLVVAGEFNAGKSAVINGLLGEAAVEEGVTPTTSRIQLVRHGGHRRRTPTGGGFEEITVPVKILREMNVVDTPGTNAVVEGHEALTRDFVPRSDLVLFVTSADRPFTASERAFLEAIRDWGKKVVVAINKTDILDKREDVEKIVGFVRESLKAQLGLQPEIFAVSARRAQKLKAAGVTPNPDADGFGALEAHVTRTLDDVERVRLKLQNPAGVAARVLESSRSALESRLAVLAADQATLDEIGQGIDAHGETLSKELRVRLSDLDKPILELEGRGDLFLERALSLRGLVDLVRAEETRQGYERRVVAGLRTSVEKRLAGIVDALAGADGRLEDLVTKPLEARRKEHGRQMSEPLPPPRKADPARLATVLKREAQRALDGYDARGEARRLAEKAQRTALVATVLILAGAVVAVTGLIAGGSTALVGGLVVGGLLALAGVVAVGALRRSEQSRLRERLSPLRQRLAATVRTVTEKERSAGIEAARGAVAPFESFVRSETTKLKARHAELTRLASELETLRGRIAGLR